MSLLRSLCLLGFNEPRPPFEGHRDEWLHKGQLSVSNSDVDFWGQDLIMTVIDVLDPNFIKYQRFGNKWINVHHLILS